MTAGFLFKYGHVVLDVEVLVLAEEKEQEVMSARDEQHTNLIAEYIGRKDAATIVIAKNRPVEIMKNDELKAVIHYKKRKGDKAVPMTKSELRTRYNATIDRNEQTMATYLLDAGYSAAAATAAAAEGE